jgi:hypothetical protein
MQWPCWKVNRVNRHNFGTGLTCQDCFYSNFISFHSVVLNKKILKDFQFRPICRLDTPLGKVTGHNFKRISQEYQCFWRFLRLNIFQPMRSNDGYLLYEPGQKTLGSRSSKDYHIQVFFPIWPRWSKCKKFADASSMWSEKLVGSYGSCKVKIEVSLQSIFVWRVDDNLYITLNWSNSSVLK